MRRYRWSDGPNDFAGASPRPDAFVKQIAGDAMPRRRGRDQSRLVCTVGQNGTTGEWSAAGPDGQALRVERDGRGLAIYSAGEAEADQADPEIVGAAPSGAANNLDALRARIAPRQVNDRTQPGNQLADYQRYLDALYSPR